MANSDAAKRSEADFFDGLWVGAAIGMSLVLALFAVMAAAGVYGG